MRWKRKWEALSGSLRSTERSQSVSASPSQTDFWIWLTGSLEYNLKRIYSLWSSFLCDFPKQYKIPNNQIPAEPSQFFLQLGNASLISGAVIRVLEKNRWPNFRHGHISHCNSKYLRESASTGLFGHIVQCDDFRGENSLKAFTQSFNKFFRFYIQSRPFDHALHSNHSRRLTDPSD